MLETMRTGSEDRFGRDDAVDRPPPRVRGVLRAPFLRVPPLRELRVVEADRPGEVVRVAMTLPT